MNDPTKVNTHGRMIETEWTIEENGDDRVVAELSVRHFGKAQMYGTPHKEYVAHLARRAKSIVRDGDGNRIGEQTTYSYDAPQATILREPVERYSAKGLEAFNARALAALADVFDNEYGKVAAIFQVEGVVA